MTESLVTMIKKNSIVQHVEGLKISQIIYPITLTNIMEPKTEGLGANLDRLDIASHGALTKSLALRNDIRDQFHGIEDSKAVKAVEDIEALLAEIQSIVGDLRTLRNYYEEASK